jgi:hypothetical protein
MAERLQHDRPRVVALAAGDLGQVDAPVLEVGDRAGRAGQVVHVVQGEPQRRRDVEDAALRERAGRVPHRLQDPGGRRLDLGKIVVPFAHVDPQLRVGLPGDLGRRALLGQHPRQLAMQTHEGVEGVRRQPAAAADHGQTQARVRLRLLEMRELDLQPGAPAGGLRPQKILQGYAERGGDALQHRQLRLALAVLDERQLRRRSSDRLAELLERHALRFALVAQALAQGHEVDSAAHRAVRK